MSVDPSALAAEALTSLDVVVSTTLQILTAYQTAGTSDFPKGEGEPQPVEEGVRSLREAKERHSSALQNLGQQLQQLAYAPKRVGAKGLTGYIDL